MITSSQNSRMARRIRRTASVGLTLTFAASIVGCGTQSSGHPSGQAKGASECRDLGLLKPGVLKVAIQTFMPIVGKKGNEISGVDGEALKYIANKLGCKIDPIISDSAGNLAAVQSHRVDISIGAWAWTSERQKAGRFTDALYYQPMEMAEKKGTNATRISDFSGRTLCTLSGFAYVPAMKQIPDAHVKTYPDIHAQLLDVAAGRCDIGFGNPLVLPYALSHNPQLKDLEIEYMAEPNSTEKKTAPLFASQSHGFQDAIYMHKDSDKLEKAMNPIIRKMVRDGVMAKILGKWGVQQPKVWLTPRPALTDRRRGVDRPAAWMPPACKGAGCKP